MCILFRDMVEWGEQQVKDSMLTVERNSSPALPAHINGRKSVDMQLLIDMIRPSYQ